MPSVVVNTSSSGNTTLVAAPGTYTSVRVLGLNLTSSSACTVSLYSGAVLLWKTYATTVTGGGIVLPDSPERAMLCAPNQPLILNLSAPVGVTGTVAYVLNGV